MRSRRVQHSLYAAYLPVLQHHLDAVGVGGAVCQDAPHHAAGAPAGGLVFFKVLRVTGRKYRLGLYSGGEKKAPKKKTDPLDDLMGRLNEAQVETEIR